MGAIKNSADVSIEFSPWTDGGKFRIVRFQAREQLGGEMPKGEMELFSDGTNEALQMVTERKTGKIKIQDEKDSGLSYEFGIYITYREYFGNTLKIKFIITEDIEFYTTRRNSWQKGGIAGIIKATFPGPSDIRIKPGGIDDDNAIYYQMCETNYEYNKRLCYSYRPDSIFAYGFSGLLLKDLCGEFDHWGNQEPKAELESNRMTIHATTYNLMFSEKVRHSPYETWGGNKEVDDCTTSENYREVESKNMKVMMDYKSYTEVGNVYTGHMYNLWKNTRLMENPGYSFFEGTLPDIPHYTLGDVLIYQRAEQVTQEESLPFKNFLVFANEIFYTIDGTKETDKRGLKFSWTTYFYGVQSGGWA